MLKTGHGVDTFLGTDLLNGSRVVIKQVTAADVGDGLQARLEHEAEVLGRLATIPFRSPIAMGVDGDFLYLVQPFVPGETLQRRLTRGPLSVRVHPQGRARPPRRPAAGPRRGRPAPRRQARQPDRRRATSPSAGPC